MLSFKDSLWPFGEVLSLSEFLHHLGLSSPRYLSTWVHNAEPPYSPSTDISCVCHTLALCVSLRGEFKRSSRFLESFGPDRRK